MRLEGQIGESGVVSINGALKPFPGAAGHIFPAMAKLLFLNPVAIQAFAWRASRVGAVARLIEGTGSRIDAAGLGYYARLFPDDRSRRGRPGHDGQLEPAAARRAISAL